MLKKAVALSSLALVLCTTLPHTAAAQETQQTQIAGILVKVDATEMKVTVKDANDQEHTITVDTTTTIKVNGQDAQLNDLKEGQHVTVVQEGEKTLSVEAMD